MIISERIFELMEERDISQIEFSRATGISQSTISDWKRKKINPSADKIMKICEVLSVTPDEILQNETKDNKLDHIIVSEGTEKYKLILEFEKLNRRGKDRLLGYVDALMEDRSKQKKE